MIYISTTEKDKSIILFFIENDNEPTHATAIAKKSGAISKKWAGDRCDHLEGSGVLSHKMVRPARQAHKTEYYFLAPTIDALHVIVDGLNDPDSRHMFMKSPYYIDMIPFLCDHFLENLHAAGMPELTEDATECLKLGLKCSESCLLFVLKKVPSELKNVFKGLEDHNDQRKKSVSYHVSEILENPELVSKIRDQVYSMFRIPHQNPVAMKRAIRPEALESFAAYAINLVSVRQPTWEMLFYGMMSRDQAFYNFWWSPEDENAVARCVLNSSNPFFADS